LPPSGVSTIRRLERLNNLTPRRFSSRDTSLLTADGVSERLRAAAEKSPSATARVKTRSSL
jgi:hypothetical protein